MEGWTFFIGVFIEKSCNSAKKDTS